MSIDSAGKDGVTPLWWAIRHHGLAGYRLLLELGANATPSIKGRTQVLEMAAGFKDPEYLRLAIIHKANVNARDPYDLTPIFSAIGFVREPQLHMLLAAGADLNCVGAGDTPLMRAAGLGRYDFVYLMLQAGAHGAVVTREGSSLSRVIGIICIRPNDTMYEWRERVIRLLRAKGIEAFPTPREGVRTKPLPPDLQ